MKLIHFPKKKQLKKIKEPFLILFITNKNKAFIIILFYPNEDYNSNIIKLCLFSFVLYYTINALFFNDSTKHKIYEDESIFNFIYLLPKKSILLLFLL
mgnify:CR=1 FL=1